MGKKKPAKKDAKKDKKKQKKSAKAKEKSKRSKPKKTARKAQPVEISHEQRLDMIRTAAYYLAEKRRFHSGLEMEDWLAAEKEIAARFPFRG